MTDDSILKISNNAKFGAVRTEIIYMGFWWNGTTVPPPVSPVDGYAYSQQEVSYFWAIHSNRSPVGGTPGQVTPPDQASGQPQNGLYNFPGGWDINDATGAVTCRTTYYSGGGAEVVTSDGIMKVWAICTRNSVNQPN